MRRDRRRQAHAEVLTWIRVEFQVVATPLLDLNLELGPCVVFGGDQFLGNGNRLAPTGLCRLGLVFSLLGRVDGNLVIAWRQPDLTRNRKSAVRDRAAPPSRVHPHPERMKSNR